MKYLHRSRAEAAATAEKITKTRNQMKYEHGISATNSNSLVEKRYSNGFATTTHYIIGTQGRELKFSFSRLCFSSLLWRTLLRVLYASFHSTTHLEQQTTESCELNWHKAKCERDVINDIFTHAQISDSSAFSAIEEPAVDWKNVRELLWCFVDLCSLRFWLETKCRIKRICKLVEDEFQVISEFHQLSKNAVCRILDGSSRK